MEVEVLEVEGSASCRQCLSTQSTRQMPGRAEFALLGVMSLVWMLCCVSLSPCVTPRRNRAGLNQTDAGRNELLSELSERSVLFYRLRRLWINVSLLTHCFNKKKNTAPPQ